jgi:hypothetical protein
MFDPEHKDIDCPKCFRRKVYFDRKIGYYCMFCAHELSADEALFLIAKTTSTSSPAPYSSRPARSPIVEIKGPQRRTDQPDHVSPDSDKLQNRESD